MRVLIETQQEAKGSDQIQFKMSLWGTKIYGGTVVGDTKILRGAGGAAAGAEAVDDPEDVGHAGDDGAHVGDGGPWGDVAANVGDTGDQVGDGGP